MTASKPRQRFAWDADSVALLRDLYANTATEALAGILDRTVLSIYNKAHALGLKKTPEFLASGLAGRLDGIRGGKTRFKPGQAAWNKGMKGLDIGGKETRFKPGHRGGKAAQLYQPIGTERISKDGYLERKINDDMPLKKRWRAVHILLWEEKNGPLPAGYALTFRDGNKQHVEYSNLELLSRADLMRRNSYHNYPKEIALAVQLRGAITRQINKRTRSKANEPNDQ